MSGPITCGYIITHGILLLAARAIEEARSMKREYGQVLSRLPTVSGNWCMPGGVSGGTTGANQRGAPAKRDAVGAPRAVALSRADAGRTGAGPRARTGSDSDPRRPQRMTTRHGPSICAELENAVRELEALLADAGGAFAEQVRATLARRGGAPTIDDVLSAYMLQRQLKPGLDADADAALPRDGGARAVPP